jgi:hypothetical protein
MAGISNLIDDNHKYKKAVKKKLEVLHSCFLEACGISVILKTETERLSVSFSEDTVTKVIEQVRRRKLYFHVYHDIEDLNKLKEALMDLAESLITVTTTETKLAQIQASHIAKYNQNR